MSTAAQIASTLKGKPITGGYLINCTAVLHNDSTPSCKIWDGENGAVRFHCFAGCDWQDIRAGAELLGLIKPFKPGHTETPQERQHREIRQAETQKQRQADELEQAKKAIVAANQIWGGTVHV